MDISARLTAILAFGALVPFGIYAVATGRLTPVMVAIGVVNIVLIAVSIQLMFGLLDDGSNGATPA